MNVLGKAGFGIGLLVWLVAPTAAQTLWLEPDPVAPGPDETVSMRLMLGDRFAGKEHELVADKVVAFQRLRKNGRENLKPINDAVPAASYTTGDDGVEIVSLTWKGRTASYYCKSVQVVGDARPGHPLRYSELGQRLEIVPQTDPVLLRKTGGLLEVQVLFEREPLAGYRVLAMPKRDPVENHIVEVTDEIGVATFELDQRGPWLLEVSYKSRETRARATLFLDAGGP